MQEKLWNETLCFILSDISKYLEKYVKYGKTFLIKVVWFEREQIRVKSIFEKMNFL